jgi:hypothetical protein
MLWYVFSSVIGLNPSSKTPRNGEWLRVVWAREREREGEDSG